MRLVKLNTNTQSQYDEICFTLQPLGAPLKPLVPNPLPVQTSLSQKFFLALYCLEEYSYINQ